MNSTNEADLLTFFSYFLVDRLLFKVLLVTGLLASMIVLMSQRFGLLSDVAKAAELSSTAGICEPFEQVNEGAFGLGTGSDSSYASEEGFEVIVFNNQLYLGMEADNSMGARLWRTKDGITVPGVQEDWEELVADENGYPFGITERAQADHIDSLAEFNSYLYVSTANGGNNTLGTRVFRSATGDPGSWQDAIADLGAGFGDINNMNFKDLQIFEGWLCGGTQNWLKGAQVWCTQDGTTWIQKNVSGFGSKYYDSNNREIWSGYVFDGALYFGVQNLGEDYDKPHDDIAKLFRTNDLGGDPKWIEVYTGKTGSYRVDILGELDDYLYIATRSSQGIVILRSLDGNANSWVQVNEPGMNNQAENIGAVVDSAVIHNNMLFVAISNSTNGFELWRTDGLLEDGSNLVDWEQENDSGLGDPKNVHSQLTSFEGSLYAWTSNYSTGQKVLRSECSGEVVAEATPSPTPYDPNSYTPLPTNTPTPTPESVVQPSSTATPVPTTQCPYGSSSCEQDSAASPQTVSLFIPLVISSIP